MEISLIDPAWHSRFLEQTKDFALSQETIKELLNGNGETENAEFAIEGATAIIPVLGPLTKTRNFLYSLFAGNNTTYDSIVQGIQAADLDEGIKDIKLRIDSPGGNWIGLTEAVQAIAAAKKPVVSEITGMATSAAYIIATQGDKVVSTTDSNDIGGLGVITTGFKFDGEKSVRSSNAEKKNPDVFTKEGEKEMVKQLDAIEAKAIKMVSDGRSAATGKAITEKVIKKDFGRGASMLADEALKLNMIDEITPAPQRVSNAVPAANTGKVSKLESMQGSDINLKKRGKFMELSELRTEYPLLCSQLVEEGRMLERDQVKGHITMAKQTGAVEFALECLDNGKSLSSQEVIAGYMSAGMNKKDLQNREADNPEGDIKPEGDTELSEQAKEDALLKSVMERSTKPARMEV